jgi:pimeloyl-ACP methyl ester carboxylesterase
MDLIARTSRVVSGAVLACSLAAASAAGAQALPCPTAAVTPQVPEDLQAESGRILLKSYRREGEVVGQYYQYLPAGSAADYEVVLPVGSSPLPVVVLVHGSPASDTDARDGACRLIEAYRADADANWFAVISPIFPPTDFDGGGVGLGGYRGMLGRHRAAGGPDPRRTDPDGFVNGVLDSYRNAHPEVFPRKTLFYGHSAGAQFLSRYLVTHPERIAALYLSAPGTVPFPDAAFTWANGMGSLTATVTYPDVPDRALVVNPSRSLFVRAAHRPVTVAVGDKESCNVVPLAGNTPGWDIGTNDAMRTAASPGYTCGPAWSPTGGGTRYERAVEWASAMRNFAGLWGPAGIRFRSVPNVGHSSAATVRDALPILLPERPETFNHDWLGTATAPVMF